MDDSNQLKIDLETGEIIEDNESTNDNNINDEINNTIDVIKGLEVLNDNSDSDVISNPLLDNSEDFSLGLTTKEIKEFYEYLAR